MVDALVTARTRTGKAVDQWWASEGPVRFGVYEVDVVVDQPQGGLLLSEASKGDLLRALADLEDGD